MLPQDDLQDLLAQAVEIVEATTQIVAEKLHAGFTYRFKEDKSPVTEIDTAVETFVRAEVERRFPGHGVLGEEFGASQPGGDYQWIVDPVDGTISLRHGIPLYGTILGLAYRGEPMLGVIALPMLNQIASGARGVGAFINGRKVELADVNTLGGVPDQVIAVGDRRQFIAAGRVDLFDRLFELHPVVRTYTDVFGHVLALQGSVGAMVDFDLKAWDAAATRVLIEEAGGRYERLPSAPGREDRHDVIFGKPGAVAWLLEELGRVGVL